MRSNVPRQASIAIVFHEVIPVGPAHDLRNYLCQKRISRLFFISHPLIYNKECYKHSSYYESYQHGKLHERRSAFHWRLPDIFLYIKDFLYTIFWSVQKGKVDLFIGLDPLNACAGLVLKSMGRTQKVVYYSIDYFTNRFENRLLNTIYHHIDKMCVSLADETWNISPAMKQSRAVYSDVRGKKYSRQITVPVGVDFQNTKRREFERINKKKIVFSGYLVPILGVDLIINSLPDIVHKIPDIKLEIVGGGPQKQELEYMTRKLRVEQYVKFYGWVSDKKKLTKIFSDCAVGLAPFNTTILHDEIRNADPAKLKDYMVHGMPVIMTDAPSNTHEIEKFKCGIIIRYDSREFVRAVVSLLMNEAKLKRYRDNALSYIKRFDFDTVYGTNIARLLHT